MNEEDLASVEVAEPNAPRQGALFIRSEQRDLADLLEVHAHRIGGRTGPGHGGRCHPGRILAAAGPSAPDPVELPGIDRLLVERDAVVDHEPPDLLQQLGGQLDPWHHRHDIVGVEGTG